jgi:predicted nucleic acid-binding protein
MTYLLDVNVLLALQCEVHPHHDVADAWLNDLNDRDAVANLATRSITKLGFVRVAWSGRPAGWG